MATQLATLRNRVRQKLVEVYALVTPAAPLAAAQGTPGASTISYVIVATNSIGHSPASQAGTVANATLSGGNFVQLNWQAVPNATGYDVYRTATNGVSPVTVGKIGSTSSTTFNDTGLAGDASTAPTLNTSGISSPFWSEQELLDILIDGCKDLWKGIVDLHQGHFVKIFDPGDATALTYPAGASATTTIFTNVPADCFRVLTIEPHNLGDLSLGTSARYFKPKQYSHQKFQMARAMTIQDTNTFLVVYYDIINPGSPVQAPQIVGAPPVGTAIPCRLVYVYSLPTLAETDNNPIPGESDNALIAWTVAYAKAKEKEAEQRTPDAGWLAVYNTEKQGLLVALTPRQEQEEEVVEGMFDGMMEDW